MKTRAIILASTLALVLPNVALAHENEFEHEASGSASVSAHREQIEIHNGHFELRGVVTAVASDKKSFAVLNKYVYLDPTVTGKLDQIGVLSVGSTVKVEGIVVASKLYARELKVQKPGKPEFKEHIRISTSSAAVTGSASPSASASESGKLRLSIQTASSSATPSASLNLNVTGTIQDILAALQRAIDFLKALL